ncbi:MAG: photosynthetic complex putative assembly protein PuhB [Lysobacterales bacterium]
MTYLTEADDIEEMETQLPEGERLVWRGQPDRAQLARKVFHWRKVAVYFGLLFVWRLISLSGGELQTTTGEAVGSLVNLCLAGAVAIGLLHLLAFLIARSTFYTLTTARVVLRFGVALPMSVNLPFSQIDNAGVRAGKDGNGDLSLKVVKGQRVSFFLMWPNVRPGHLLSPQPSLRCLNNVQDVAQKFLTAIEATAGNAAPAQQENASVSDRTVGQTDLPLAPAGH